MKMYCTINEVEEMLKEDTLNAIVGNTYIETAGERSEKIQLYIESAIKDACNEIDGYLVKYPLPLSNVPSVINKYSKDISVYNLYSRVGINENDREKNYLNRYNAAIQYLIKIAEGKIDLFPSSSSIATTNGKIKIHSSNRLFSRERLGGM